MSNSISFEKYECEILACFVCKDGGWQLSKEFGFHKCSPPRDYLVFWIAKDGKWSLCITTYNNTDLEFGAKEIILTVDTLFDVFDYICKNRYLHY